MIVPSKEAVVMVGADSKEMFIFDAKTGAVLKKLRDEFIASGVAAYYNVGEQLIAVQSQRTFVSIWNVHNQEPFLKVGTTENISVLMVSKIDQCLYGGSVNGNLYIWELPSGILLKKMNIFSKQIKQIQAIPTGYLICGSLTELKLYSIGSILMVQNTNPLGFLALSDLLLYLNYERDVLIVATKSNIYTYSLIPLSSTPFTKINQTTLQLVLSVANSSNSLYAGDYKGSITVIPLFPSETNHFTVLESEQVSLQKKKGKDIWMSTKKVPITALCYLKTLGLLISGSSEGEITVWSEGVVKKSMHLYKSAILNLMVIVRPQDHISDSKTSIKALHKFQQVGSAVSIVSQKSVTEMIPIQRQNSNQNNLRKIIETISDTKTKLMAEVAQLSHDRDQLRNANLHYCRMLMKSDQFKN